MIQPFSGLAEDLILSVLAVARAKTSWRSHGQREAVSPQGPAFDPERRFRHYRRPTAL